MIHDLEPPTLMKSPSFHLRRRSHIPAVVVALPLVIAGLHAAEAPVDPAVDRRFAEAAENAKLVREFRKSDP